MRDEGVMMVHELHKDHIILWEEGDAYIHISPERLMDLKAQIVDDVEDKMGWRKYGEILKKEGIVLKEVSVDG